MVYTSQFELGMQTKENKLCLLKLQKTVNFVLVLLWKIRSYQISTFTKCSENLFIYPVSIFPTNALYYFVCDFFHEISLLTISLHVTEHANKQELKTIGHSVILSSYIHTVDKNTLQIDLSVHIFNLFPKWPDPICSPKYRSEVL